jgi:integrase
MKPTKSYEKPTSPLPLKMRGLYRRGKIFWYSKMVEGRRTQISLSTEDQGAAVAKVLAMRQQPELLPVNTYEAEVEAYIKEQVFRGKLSHTFAPNRKSSLLQFGRVFKIMSPVDITTDKARQWYDWMRFEKQPALKESTAQGYIFGLRAFLGWLVDRSKLRENVALKLELDEYKHTARLVFADGVTVASLIENAPDDAMRFILYCGFHAGMRKLEIIEARPHWFDLKAGAVTIQATETFQTKDKDHRTVPLTSGFKAFIVKYGLPSPFMLMPHVPKGLYKYRYDFRKPFEEYIKSYAAGKRRGTKELAPVQDLSWLTPHVMRHTFASLHAAAGTSIYKIALWLGDGVEVVQRHYAKLSPSDADINKAFDEPAPVKKRRK